MFLGIEFVKIEEYSLIIRGFGEVFMKHLSFEGGIHPGDFKDIAKNHEIKEVLPGDIVLIPLSQHIGAPAIPLVEKGDEVLVGQLIAEAGGFVSANVHSSVSGKVKGIKSSFSTTGFQVQCIEIENNHLYEHVSFDSRLLENVEKEEILERIKNAGVVGMGGAGFPSHVKLAPKNPEAIDCLIVNAAECEPYITADYRCMLEASDEFLLGIEVVLKLFDKAVAYIGIEDNKMDCIALLQDKCKDKDNIKVIPLVTKYPQGGERQLIHAITGRKLNSSMLPNDVGCIVNNVESFIAIKKAVIDGIPAYQRILTLSGDCLQSPGNYLISVGMTHQELIDQTGGFVLTPSKIISGGPMMGFSIFHLDTPFTKTSSSIVCLHGDVVSMCESSVCINCGRCVSVCPSKLVPSRLAKAAENGDQQGFMDYHGLECIECGSCSYVCPAKKHLKQSISNAKKQIIAKNRGKK